MLDRVGPIAPQGTSPRMLHPIQTGKIATRRCLVEDPLRTRAYRPRSMVAISTSMPSLDRISFRQSSMTVRPPSPRKSISQQAPSFRRPAVVNSPVVAMGLPVLMGARDGHQLRQMAQARSPRRLRGHLLQRTSHFSRIAVSDQLFDLLVRLVRRLQWGQSFNARR